MWTVGTLTERAAARRSGSCAVPVAPLQPGRAVVVGREGEVRVGADPLDTRISRRALTVEVDDDRCALRVANVNGAFVHPWGLRATRVRPGGEPEVHRWPRVAVRLLGSDDLTHWVLLEHTAPAPAPSPPPDTGETELRDAPRPLTPQQAAVLRTVFEPQLAWPPSLEPPRQVKQAATRMGIAESTVKGHLEEVHRRAVRLGLSPTLSGLAPECLHVLVGTGYLTP